MTLLELPEIVDLRRTASQKHVYGKRSWASITGATLHQTACLLGERPARWETVGCHVGVTRGGQRIWLHPFESLVAGGNGWNNGCVQIEVDGLYAGIEGDASTVWNDPTTAKREAAMTLTPEAIAATCDVLRWIKRSVTDHGGNFRALVSHRQSSDSRRADPGEAIWKAIALPMMAELGLSDGGVGFCLEGGRPNPECWDARAVGVKY